MSDHKHKREDGHAKPGHHDKHKDGHHDRPDKPDHHDHHGRHRRHGEGHGLTLAQLPPGSRGRITAVGGEGALRRRLLDMGLTPKTMVLVRKVAPMGDPIELYLRSYELTLRKEDAKKIFVQEEPENYTVEEAAE